MTNTEQQAEREKLWVDLTAASGDIYTRVLLMAGSTGSLFDASNPRRRLFRKLDHLTGYPSLTKLEESFKASPEGGPLIELAKRYNEIFLKLVQQAYTKEELAELGITASGELLPSPELQKRYESAS